MEVVPAHVQRVREPSSKSITTIQSAIQIQATAPVPLAIIMMDSPSLVIVGPAETSPVFPVLEHSLANSANQAT